MRRDFGLSLTCLPLVVEVIVAPTGALSAPEAPLNRLRVPSPTILTRPVEISDTELLRLLILAPLAGEVIDQARQANPPMDGTWWMLTAAWRAWEIDRHSPLLANWPNAVIGYQHRDRQMGTMPQALPSRAAGLWQQCEIWRLPELQLILTTLAPVDLCRPPADTSAVLHAPISLHLDTLYPIDVEFIYSTQAWPAPGYWLPIIKEESLLDYTVDTFGRATLPALWQGLGEHKDWQTLIPAVFGVSAEEFEAGWQSYVKGVGET